MFQSAFLKHALTIVTRGTGYEPLQFSKAITKVLQFILKVLQPCTIIVKIRSRTMAEQLNSDILIGQYRTFDSSNYILHYNSESPIAQSSLQQRPAEVVERIKWCKHFPVEIRIGNFGQMPPKILFNLEIFCLARTKNAGFHLHSN